jgi:hypothetical protein
MMYYTCHIYKKIVRFQKTTMNLVPSTPAAKLFAPLGSSAFGGNGFSLDSHKPTNNPNFISPSTFSNAAPTEFGMQTNKSIPYHFSAKSADPNKFSPGALLFSWRSPRRFGLQCPDKSRYVEDLIEVNKWLKSNAAQKMQTAHDVCEEIQFVGVLKGAITANSRERSLGTCVMNTVVGQRASAVNVWGSTVREGTSLYFIVKKVSEGTNCFWKFQPHAGDYPGLSELICTDPSTNETVVGTTVFVGTAMSTPTACAEGCEALIDDPCRSQRLACYAGGVDVCIGV